MTYRGDDLDLRTHRAYPHHRPEADGDDEGANGSLERYSPSRRPIWVDDLVLACCNQAYDIAANHRAPEVRVEHLLNAMTRVEAAAEALETRGVRVYNLRRETANVIAHELPVLAKDAQINPRRSDELEEILRRAAALGYRQGVADGDVATVEEVIEVLLDARYDLPSIGMARPHVRQAREYLPVRRSFAMDGDLSYAPARISRDRGQHTQMRRDFASDAKGQDIDLNQVLDRLAAVERALVELKAASAAQPRLVETAIGKIEGAVKGAADDGVALWGDVAQSLKGIEDKLAKAPLAPINDRLALIEEAVLADESAESRFLAFRDAMEHHKIASLTAYSSIEGEIAKLSEAVSRSAEAARSSDIAALPARLGAAVAEQSERHGERIGGLFASILDGKISGVAEQWTVAYKDAASRNEQRLTSFETSLTGALRLLEGKQKTVASSIEHFGKASGECLDHIDARLERLESAGARADSMIEDLHRLELERRRSRSRFWRWLFGADDWLAASWPKAASRVDMEMAVKGARV